MCGSVRDMQLTCMMVGLSIAGKADPLAQPYCCSLLAVKGCEQGFGVVLVMSVPACRVIMMSCVRGVRQSQLPSQACHPMSAKVPMGTMHEHT